MGLYDDNDENVTRAGGGWAAATHQATTYRIEQKKRQDQAREAQRQREAQAAQQQQPKPGFATIFKPQRMAQPNRLTPTSIRPSNINKAKVPVPNYRNIQAATHRAAAEKVEGEKRDVIDRFPDEYDPLKPNDYGKFLKRRREGKHKLSKYAHFKKTSTAEKSADSQGNNDSSSSDEEVDNRRKAAGLGKAMIAPPTQLYVPSNPSPNQAKKPSVGTLGAKLGMTGPLGLNKLANKSKSLFGRKPDGADTAGGGSGLSVAEKIMAKYGHKEGAGLGKMNQGIAAPLEVEKTSRRGGKIVATKPATSSYGAGNIPAPPPATPPPPPNIRKLPNLSKPTKIVCLMNMVSKEEVDADLPGEITGECSKFGNVVRGIKITYKVQICEIPNVPPSEEVRIFLEFSRMEEAMKAVIGLHNRFFNQRNLVAAFYDIGLYEKGELTAPTNG